MDRVCRSCRTLHARSTGASRLHPALAILTTLLFAAPAFSPPGLMSSCMPVARADEELLDEQAGLTAIYRSTGNQTLPGPQIERIDDRIAFDWGKVPPDRRLPNGPFEAAWNGTILIRDSIEYVWHAELQGSAKVVVGDHVVLEGQSSDRAFISSQPIRIEVGEYPVRIEFRSTDEACFKLFWSADSFTLEPLPGDILFHKPSRDLNLAQNGQWVADAFRCHACHQSGTSFEALPAPSLKHVMAGNSRASLIQRLINPQEVVSNSRMPSFGLSLSEAEAIAAYLQSANVDLNLNPPPKGREEDVARGHQLLHSLGCVVCHQLSTDSSSTTILVTETATAMPYEGPALTTIANRRTPAWIHQWLKSPEVINSKHRMPAFALSDNELRELTAALSQSPKSSSNSESSNTESAPGNQSSPGNEPPSSDADKELIESGRALILKSGCASCHEIPGIDPASAGLKAIDQTSINRAGLNCLRPSPDAIVATDAPPEVPSRHDHLERNGRFVPQFNLSAHQTAQLESWFQSYQEPPDKKVGQADGEASSMRGDYLLRARGCLACHDRDTHRGISRHASQLEQQVAELKGQSENLIPPQLTAAGDRIEPGYLLRAVSGQPDERRLPWLQIRMPRFVHKTGDAESLVQALVAADLIPDSADHVRSRIAEAATDRPASPEDLLTGNTLAGAAGFNCVACHKAGPFEPRFVAPGTRGSDLMTMGKRIRPRYFQRWMRNPIRVMTGIEMPAIRRAAPGIANETLDTQFEILWRALKDPRFTPPTVVSRYEQYWTVLPGQRPRIVRDVFTLTADRSDSIARTFAVGFGNGHHLFLDLDSMQNRLWSIGEFARQRTEGKSWFWDPAGITVAKFSRDSGNQHWIELHRVRLPNDTVSSPQAPLLPIMDEGRSIELVRYHSDETQVRLWYRVYFETVEDPVPNTLQKTEPQPERGQNRNAEALPESPHLEPSPWANKDRPVQSILIEEVLSEYPEHAAQTPEGAGKFNGIRRELHLREAIAGYEVALRFPQLSNSDAFQPSISTNGDVFTSREQKADGQQRWYRLTTDRTVTWDAAIGANPAVRPVPQKPVLRSDPESITSVPGFQGRRLPLDASIMPTSMTWLADGRLAFTSLRGHVWIARDSDGDHLEDELTLFEEGLAAPFGILTDGNSILVAHKPEILRLTDTDGDGKADEREVVASGWGYSDDYHDWTTGLVRDANQNLYVGLGSDYSQKQRAIEKDRWRGTVLKIDPSGIRTPIAFSFRYPMGLALDSRGRLFATDNQGVQNTFNEINHIQPGRHYGVPSRNETMTDRTAETPALQIPHPWTRSVNSIQFLPDIFASVGMQGHGIGCEYDLRFLVRFTTQEVGTTMQGCVYPLSRPEQPAGGTNFIGPVSSAISPDGAIYIGSIWDSGWQGGQNTGAIERIEPGSTLNAVNRSNGIQEVRAIPGGFEIEFFEPVDRMAARSADNYSILGYTRIWGGSYATPDSERYQCQISELTLSEDAKTVVIRIEQLKPGFVYEISVKDTLDSRPMWPTTAAYTLKQIP